MARGRGVGGGVLPCALVRESMYVQYILDTCTAHSYDVPTYKQYSTRVHIMCPLKKSDCTVNCSTQSTYFMCVEQQGILYFDPILGSLHNSNSRPSQ